MTARQIKGKWFVDFWFEHPTGQREQIRKASPVATKRGAGEYERQLRAEMLGPTEKPKVAPTLAEFSSEFLETYAASNNRPSELRSKRSIYKIHLLPLLGGRRLDEISPRHIEGYKSTKVKAGRSAKSINNDLTVLRKTLSVARDWGLIEQVPAFHWMKPPAPEFDFLSAEEGARLVHAAEPGWSTMMLTALRTGLRVGELLALRWDDVDLVVGRLVVRRSSWRGHLGPPKNGRNREVPLSPDALEALKAQRHLRGELVFCAADGTPWRENQLRRPLYRACKRAGLRRIGWHVLRHSFASQLVARGVVLKAVQELMGHSTIQMTLRYSHLSPDARRDAVRLLDGELGQQLGSGKAGAG